MQRVFLHMFFNAQRSASKRNMAAGRFAELASASKRNMAARPPRAVSRTSPLSQPALQIRYLALREPKRSREPLFLHGFLPNRSSLCTLPVSEPRSLSASTKRRLAPIVFANVDRELQEVIDVFFSLRSNRMSNCRFARYRVMTNEQHA